MGAFGVAISYAFVYRLAAITQSIPKLHNKKSIIGVILIHIFYTTPIIIPLFYSFVINREAVMTEIEAVVFRHNFLISLKQFRDFQCFTSLV
jgi:hypothetical protein